MKKLSANVWDARASTRSALFALLVASSLAIGCSSSPASVSLEPAGTNPDTEALPFDPLEPNASLLCDVQVTPGGRVEPEFYVVSAMNHKLRTYPEFASALGMQMVSDCEGARAFLRGYAEYVQTHRGFDADEPLPPLSESEPPPPDDYESSIESPKIFNGSIIINNPVVQLGFVYSGTTDPTLEHLSRKEIQCTGTFIAKNWILTAAHCLMASAIDKCITDNISRQDCRPKWDHYSKWAIVGTHSAEHTPYTLGTKARAYIHSKWLGTTRNRNPHICDNLANCYDLDEGADHDLGLIYLGDDGVLPPYVEADNAMRLSTVTPSNNWTMDAWGWGQTGVANDILAVRKTTLQPVFTVQDERIDAVLPITNWSFACEGDSGGPLLRPDLRIQTNVGDKVVSAIVGVLSSGWNRCEPPPTTTDPEAVWRWTRVDTKSNKDFITEALQHWPVLNRKLKCTPRRLVTGNPPVETGSAVMDECWGKECRGDTCVKGVEACSRPGRELDANEATCEVCGAGKGCGCIVGQCLPKY